MPQIKKISIKRRGQPRLFVFQLDITVDIGVPVGYNILMKSIKLRAFAKANLSLNITGRRDGLHTLDSVMVSLDAFDTVTVTERGDKAINVSFIGADGISATDNTAYRAAKSVQDIIDCGGFDISVEKGIPIGAGLGGSSADGAAVLRALDIFYRLPARGVDMRTLALSVGSDVPFMLTGGTARVGGKGEELYFIKNKLELFAVGLMSESVSTAAAYKTFDEQNPSCELCLTDNAELCERLMTGDGSAVNLFANALEKPAETLAPSVKIHADKLSACGAKACLTGSGGMTLGWYTDLDAFAKACASLKSEAGFRAFTTTNIGILHEWVEKE